MSSRPTWFRLDADLFDNPKIMRAGPEATLLWMRGIAYSARHLTDGWIPEPLPKRWGYNRKHTQAWGKDAGALSCAGAGCEDPAGAAGPVAAGVHAGGVVCRGRRMLRFGQTEPVQVDFITTPGGVDVLANLQRKARQADVMFAALVQHMNNAMTVDTRRGDLAVEVPRWVS